MALFSFQKKEHTSAVLLDIGSASVAGAYVYVVEGSVPVIHYTARLTIERRANETAEVSMQRTLETLVQLLIREGAPTFRRETGAGSTDSILVSVAAPWQETTVRTETYQQDAPFVFTKALMQEIVERAVKVPEDRRDSGESVIATTLNGYEVANPIGKKVSRAEMVVLSSSILRSVAESIEHIVRTAFHTHDITFVAFAPLTYSVFRELYPHEKDFLILDVSGEGTDLAFIRHGVLMDVSTTPHGTHALLTAGKSAVETTRHEEAALPDPILDGYINQVHNARFGQHVAKAEEEWIASLADMLRAFAGKHPLPRTLFLLADDDVRDFLVRALDSSSLHTLWLSDEPLRIVPVLPAQFSSYVQTKSLGSGDIFLAVLAMYFGKGVIAKQADPSFPPPTASTPAP